MVIWFGILVAASILLVVIGPSAQRDVYLDPEGTGSQGIGALIAVLREQGVDVRTVTTLEDLRREATDLDGSSYAVAVGPSLPLTLDGADVLLMDSRSADRLILLDGGAPVLTALDQGLRALPVNARLDPLPAECSDPVTRDGATVGLAGARIIDESVDSDVPDGPGTASPSSTVNCYPLVDDAGATRGHLLVTLQTADGLPVTAVGFGPALTNRRITEDGHAAVGLRLLGASPHLIFYTPSVADVIATSGTPVDEVRPPEWLIPALTLVAIAVVVLALASGRRLGRLVPEPLPVIIKASETTHSRAELYRKARDRARAAAALRAGTESRVRRSLRLGTRVDAEATRAAMVARGIPLGEAAALTGPDPATDAELVQLAQDLSALEEKVTHDRR